MANILKVAAPPSEAERLERMQREALEAINRRLTDEIAPQLRAEIVAEVKGTLEETRKTAFDHGHSVGMSKLWRFMVGGAVAGAVFTAAIYGVAVNTGGYIANMESKNDEIRRLLDQ
jgi:hypothetical protein